MKGTCISLTSVGLNNYSVVDLKAGNYAPASCAPMQPERPVHHQLVAGWVFWYYHVQQSELLE